MSLRRLIPFVVAAFAALSATAEAITVSGVTISQNPLTRLVTVDYALSGEPAIVTVDFLTNGVSIGEANFRNVFGDVNRLVDTNGTRRIGWRPALSWPGNSFAEKSLTAKVTAWTVDDPPDYLVADLDVPSGIPCISYYTSTNALPYGGITNDIYRTSRIVMRRIRAAGVKWLMGNGVGEPKSYETPHYVTFTEDYWLAVFETTQEQHRMFCGDGYSGIPLNCDSRYALTRPDVAVSPKVNIQYYKLRGTSAKVNKYRTLGTDSCFAPLRTKTGIDFDLPTDAQWEYAARAGGSSLLWGDIEWNINIFKVYEWYYSNSAKHTEANGYPGGDGYQHGHRVGSKPPNPFGLYDMLGNVSEICLDVYTADLGTGDVVDPIVSSGSDRVRRGGNVNNAKDKDNLRGTYRTKIATGSSDHKIGYRLMCPLTLKFPVVDSE